eukprot:Hpha_TRINITY_DN34720_c0_g1::TRINITY_DN34720_c0_g1_i1::g.178033::m.178033
MPGLRDAGKAVQRHAFTLLSTKWGLCLLLLTGVGLMHSVLLTVESILEVGLLCPPPRSDRDFRGNIAGKSHEDFLCHEPIDAVYTWVNGSDPFLKRSIARYKALEEILEAGGRLAEGAAEALAEELGNSSGSGGEGGADE